MQHKQFQFSAKRVSYYFDADSKQLKQFCDPAHTILITDEHVHVAHGKKWKGWKTIVLKAGEEYKLQQTVDAVIDTLIEMEADRKTMLVGIGGGVITDLTGYIASIYMRGIRFGFVPTTLLSMIDASIGGKNGVDVGVYKNLVGTIRQPEFILFDTSLLKTLPDSVFRDGFTEIIKHAAILDAPMFKWLEAYTPKKLRNNRVAMNWLVTRNAVLKSKLVQRDEFEQGDRKLLNFGHTLGHALENQYELSHGEAVSIGMTYAANFSEKYTKFKQTDRLTALLTQYGLPTYAAFDAKKVFDVLKHDKKRNHTSMQYVLLQKIGKAVIQPIALTELAQMIQAIK